MRLGELAERIGGVLHGDPEIEITGVAGIREAGAGDLTFIAGPRYEADAATTGAAAIVVGANHRRFARPVIEHPDPVGAFFMAVSLLRPPLAAPHPGIHPTAVIGPGVKLGTAVAVGAQAVVEPEAEIGDESIVGDLVHVGAKTKIGRGTRLYPQVVIREECVLGDRVIVHSGTVIGSDGFGFRREGSRHVKIPQVGRVVIGDDVEIGAGCAIDRGTIGDTVIGRGSKLDNLVHIGHNVRIGEDALLIAQVGIGGSTLVGSRVTLAGQVGIVGHIEIGADSQIGAQAGVIGSLPAGGRYWGTPATALTAAKRTHAAMRRAPELLRTVAALERRLAALETRVRAANADASPPARTSAVPPHAQAPPAPPSEDP